MSTGTDPSVGAAGRTAFAAGAGSVLAALLFAAAPLEAQTDFYNLDKDRPLRVEDAHATKQYAFEIQASPLTLSQDEDGVLRFAPALELKHGLLPGVEVSAGTHLDVDRLGGATSVDLGTVELSSLVNLWVEGRTLPAVGLRVTGHVPTGSDTSGWVEIRGLATRGLFGPVRAHLNGAWLGGSGRPDDWWVGLAVDYVLPFRHLLVLAETWVADPGPDRGAASPVPGDPLARTVIPEPPPRTVHSGLGIRYQLSPTLTLDAGVGRDWRGDEARDWTLTLGFTHEFAVRALMPRGPR